MNLLSILLLCTGSGLPHHWGELGVLFKVTSCSHIHFVLFSQFSISALPLWMHLLYDRVQIVVLRTSMFILTELNTFMFHDVLTELLLYIHLNWLYWSSLKYLADVCLQHQELSVSFLWNDLIFSEISVISGPHSAPASTGKASIRDSSQPDILIDFFSFPIF